MNVLSPFVLSAGMVLALSVAHGTAMSDNIAEPVFPANTTSDCAPCREFDRINSMIRDGDLPKREAKAEVSVTLREIDEWYRQAGTDAGSLARSVFPLKGYTVTAVGRGRNHGYLQAGYSYFDGNRHGGHPSLDIFIRDREQRAVDDVSGEPVAVLSITGGVVVAAMAQWDPASALRGGKYLWIYDPAAAVLVYYAHHRELAVEAGDLVRPGDLIALVGRTGANACRRRSPTHLHLTCLSVATGRPVPRNIYPELAGSRMR